MLGTSNVRNSKLKTAGIDPSVTHLPLPSSVSSLYSTSLNPDVSDDFNDTTVDFTKWQYRTDGTAKWGTNSDYVYIVQSGSDRFLTLKGNSTAGKGSGLSSRKTTKYGFYIVRWQVVGWTNNTANGWHPAVWGAGCDFSGSTIGNCIPEASAPDSHVLEADFVEGMQGNPAWWSSHMLLWNAAAIYQNITFRPQSTIWPNTSWSTMGMEYNPNYIAVWEYSSGAWTKLKQVPISSAPTTQTNINSAYRTPLYWIFSNNRIDSTLITADSWLRLDYFYDYNYTGPI